MTQGLYDAIGGEAGLRRLAAAWHARVLDDEVVAHAFSHGFRTDHVERLAAYLAEALGGPPAYTSRFGDETSVVRLHSGQGEHEEMDQRAVACFDGALGDLGVTEPGLCQALHDYFASATASLARYPASADDVPPRLRLRRWTWEGPEPEG